MLTVAEMIKKCTKVDTGEVSADIVSLYTGSIACGAISGEVTEESLSWQV